jgi:hypothetical protein
MIHLFLFDIDGVLVDARAYQKALRDTVSHFSRLMGLGDHPPTGAQVRAFEANGLNSEWDSGAACVAALLLERLRREPAFALAPRWPDTLSALATHPCPLPPPDYAALAKKIGARLGGLSPAQAAHAVLWDEAQAIPGLDCSRLAPLLEALLGQVHDFYHAPVTRHFQHLVLGSQAINQTYGVSPDLQSPAYLRRYDRPLLTPATRALLFEKIASGQVRAALYTTRPSLPPTDAENEPVTGYAPEAEMAQELVGLETWPLVGRGRLRWLARRAGEELGSLELGSLLKPFPVQALAAIGAAWSGQEKAALTAALALHRQGKLIPPLADLEPVTVHVFEDSPGGLQAVELGVEALRAAGLTISWQPYGIARAGSPKAATLAARGAPVYPSINEAVLDAETRISVDRILLGLDRQIQARSGDLAIPLEQFPIY